MLSSSEVSTIRARFPIFQKKVYLNSCSQGALSYAVEEGIQEYITSWHEHGSPWEIWVEQYEAARTQFARFIGATADEVAIVPHASAGINSIASALSFDRRKKVVMGEFEFPTMGHIWLAQRKRGAQIEFVSAVGNHIPVVNYERAIDDNTLIVPVTGVCFMNGFRSPVNEVAQLAHANGALVMLDDYQDCGTRPVSMRATDVDFYVTGTLKYLLGPPGLAFLYVRRELIEKLTPTVTSWMGHRDVFAFNTKQLDLASAARRFECGTPAIPNIYMARAALELLAGIGMDDVAARIERLTRTF